MHARTRANTHTHARIHTRTHTCTDRHTDTDTDTQTHTHTHTSTRAHTHTHTHMHRQTHRHTHTHTHTIMSGSFFLRLIGGKAKQGEGTGNYTFRKINSANFSQCWLNSNDFRHNFIPCCTAETASRLSLLGVSHRLPKWPSCATCG